MLSGTHHRHNTLNLPGGETLRYEIPKSGIAFRIRKQWKESLVPAFKKGCNNYRGISLLWASADESKCIPVICFRLFTYLLWFSSFQAVWQKLLTHLSLSACGIHWFHRPDVMWGEIPSLCSFMQPPVTLSSVYIFSSPHVSCNPNARHCVPRHLHVTQRLSRHVGL
jgi:hypothetical protein